MVKTALKLLLVFVEYTESNAALLVKAVNVVDAKRGTSQVTQTSVQITSDYRMNKLVHTLSL